VASIADIRLPSTIKTKMTKEHIYVIQLNNLLPYLLVRNPERKETPAPRSSPQLISRLY
jgi:hypothetical protein